MLKGDYLMNGFSGWLRQFPARMLAGIRHFMAGRYGMDKLNMVILWTGVAASLLSAIISWKAGRLSVVALFASSV